MGSGQAQRRGKGVQFGDAEILHQLFCSVVVGDLQHLLQSGAERFRSGDRSRGAVIGSARCVDHRNLRRQLDCPVFDLRHGIEADQGLDAARRLVLKRRMGAREDRAAGLLEEDALIPPAGERMPMTQLVIVDGLEQFVGLAEPTDRVGYPSVTPQMRAVASARRCPCREPMAAPATRASGSDAAKRLVAPRLPRPSRSDSSASESVVSSSATSTS